MPRLILPTAGEKTTDGYAGGFLYLGVDGTDHLGKKTLSPITPDKFDTFDQYLLSPSSHEHLCDVLLTGIQRGAPGSWSHLHPDYTEIIYYPRFFNYHASTEAEPVDNKADFTFVIAKAPYPRKEQNQGPFDYVTDLEQGILKSYIIQNGKKKSIKNMVVSFNHKKETNTVEIIHGNSVVSVPIEKDFISTVNDIYQKTLLAYNINNPYKITSDCTEALLVLHPRQSDQFLTYTKDGEAILAKHHKGKVHTTPLEDYLKLPLEKRGKTLTNH